MKNILYLVFNVLICISTTAQSIRINEFSQGASGAKEWVELVVSSATTITNSNCVLAKVNIAGWVLDDNNGDFSPLNHFTGSGMATGHMRFKNELPWNNLPVGAIIVIYNAADRDLILPADDPYDWVNNDCVYIVPSNHLSLEYCTTLPAASSCIVRTNYAACTYVSTGTWANIGLANAGDGIQVRDPSFNLIHGVVYGKSTNVSGCTTTVDMVGNAVAPLISNVAMSGTSAAFVGTSDAEYFDATKWTIQSATVATPGAYNSATNETYIFDTLRGSCTCNKILPIKEEDLYVSNYRKTTEINLINEQLIVNFKYREKYIYDVIIYDNFGRLQYRRRITKPSNENRLDIATALKSGMNYIRVIIHDNFYSSKTIKYIK